MDAGETLSEIDVDCLPLLDTQIGMVGHMAQVEVGGQICLENGIIVAIYIV